MNYIFLLLLSFNIYADNIVSIDVTNESNSVSITQTGTQEYESLVISGTANVVSIAQIQVSGQSTQDTFLNGNSNSYTTAQSGYGQTMFNSITGDNNTVNSTQSGTGGHYLSSSLSGTGNSLTTTQTGATANNATISLTNSGGAASLNLVQSGGQSVSITSICVTNGGCSTIQVRQ